VLHALPGYWDARDLAQEMLFAAEMHRLWHSGLTRPEKDRRFRAAQLAHIATHDQGMVDRSVMQGFDKKFELKKRPETSDCILRAGSLEPKLRPGGGKKRKANAKPKADDQFKTTDQIVHERMAARPFVPFEQFDIAKFVDYGRPKYDKHNLDGDECEAGAGAGAKPGMKPAAAKKPAP
jgi:hypothetical protein